jgi:hypothetical protein
MKRRMSKTTTHGSADPLPRRDQAIVAMLVTFIVVALLVELYFIIHRHELVALAGSSSIAHLFEIYGAADRAYYDAVSPLALGLETINVFVTQILNVWLIYAIVWRRPFRHALQLALASYLSYSVILYFWVNHLDGYANMHEHSAGHYWLLYLPNLPWLVAYVYMVQDSARAIVARFREADPR